MYVGYYTQALGLGRKPTDTSIRNLRVDNPDPYYYVGALCSFWRGAENLKVDNSWGAVTWSVSQASPLRRTHIEGDLHFF